MIIIATRSYFGRALVLEAVAIKFFHLVTDGFTARGYVVPQEAAESAVTPMPFRCAAQRI